MYSSNCVPSLPNYLAEGLPKQERATLEDTREYIEAPIEYREQLATQPIGEDDIPEDAELIEDADDGSKGAVIVEYRTCGDDSCHYMSGGEKHGHYRYRAYWDGGIVRREYLGKA